MTTVNTANAPRIGTMFVHRYWVDWYQNPIVCTVTAIRRGAIHYAVIDKHDDGTRWIRGREWCTPDRWPHVCEKITLTPNGKVASNGR